MHIHGGRSVFLGREQESLFAVFSATIFNVPQFYLSRKRVRCILPYIHNPGLLFYCRSSACAPSTATAPSATPSYTPSSPALTTFSPSTPTPGSCTRRPCSTGRARDRATARSSSAFRPRRSEEGSTSPAPERRSP